MKSTAEFKNEFNDISTEIFETYVKPLCRHPETGEQCESDYSDATAIVEMVLRSELVKNLLYHFWQSASDACPLEVGEAENQEQAFKKWLSTIMLNY
ncbi:MAG: hypothetical protein V4547_17210 [Bacteroidota bacterium]